jgi:hypothetical protein
MQQYTRAKSSFRRIKKIATITNGKNQQFWKRKNKDLR